jgi:glycosyltransferase involved in cell wall biosynthesis
MKVLSYVKGLDGCSYHRIYLPNQQIEENRVVGQLSEEDLQWCDILHYSRHTMVAVDFLNKYRDKYGFKIVVDTDDWWEVGKDHPNYEWWSKSNVSLQVRQHLMNADAVTTTHERLASLIPNDNVYVLPNTVQYGKGQFKNKKQPTSDRVRLLYASTVMNYSNTVLIAGAMRKLAHLPIEVVIAGYDGKNPLFDIVVKNLTAGQIPFRTKPWAEVKKYMSSYEGDIGIIPSKPTQFNSLKSNLKVLEYAALKMPVVVSKCDPYLDLPVNYFSGENEFVDQVTKLVTDLELRKSSGEQLYKFCKENYNMTPDARIKAYEQIIQRSNRNSR